jgi:hypothetical protein
MVGDPVSVPPRHLLLERLDLRFEELDHLPATGAKKMVVMLIGKGPLERETPIPQVDFPSQPTGDQVPERAINGGKTRFPPSLGVLVEGLGREMPGVVQKRVQKSLALGRPTKALGGHVSLESIRLLGMGSHRPLL